MPRSRPSGAEPADLTMAAMAWAAAAEDGGEGWWLVAEDGGQYGWYTWLMLMSMINDG